MNLQKLFSMQKELDDYIVKTKGLEGQDLLPQKILALQVELGECANEWRGFKFWSENQKPRTNVDKVEGWPDPLLEEYIDCLHFILSIGLVSGFTDLNYVHEGNIEVFKSGKGIAFQFIYTLAAVSTFVEDVTEKDKYEDIFCYFNSLGSMLDFTWEQIESAYTEKWNINKKRQESGY